MADTTWSWAELDEQQLELVDDVERELGAEFVLVYRPGPPGIPTGALGGVEPSPLDAAKIDRLRGLEAQVGGVAVAYRRAR